MADIAAAQAELAHLAIDTDEASLASNSQDFFWYSPVLKSRLAHVKADFILCPRNEAEVIEILRVCFKHNVPVTTRGWGTGNYGQAMPLAGGCILHMRHMDQVKEIHPGRVIVEPGCRLKSLDLACREHSGQEIRMFSSTWAKASVGGFIAGGSGGVGSVTWGQLRDLGNIIRLRVVTMEAEPRIVEFTGEEIPRVAHAYGTNGIITELELPLAPAYEWVEMFVGFRDFMESAQYAADLANEDGILIKLATPIEAPIAYDYFPRIKPHIDRETNLVGLMVAPHAMDAFLTFTARRPSAEIIYRSDQSSWARSPGPVFEYAWNHTTLRAIAVDPKITYLQVRYGYPTHMEKVARIRKIFGDEVLQHLEVIREKGKIMFAGLPIVKFTTEERLNEIVKIHEAEGCMIFNPHRYTLEEGGRQTVDDRQLRFKREADPKGLLNPGKMIAWDEPEFDFKDVYRYQHMQAAQ